MGRVGKHLSPEMRRRIRDAIIAAGSNANISQIARELKVNRTSVQKISWQLRDGDTGSFDPPRPKTPEERESEVEAERRITSLRDENRELRAKLVAAHRDSIEEDAIKEILGVMASAPEQPPEWLRRVPAKSATPTPEVPVTIWSDWHMGEVVDRDEVGGVNEFNIEIGERRVRRLLDSIVDLCANHGPGSYPGIVVNLLGDFVSGGLHPELLKTDEEEVIPATLRCRDLLIAGLTRMADTFGQVYVPCAAGNHGRATIRPEFKRYFAKNFDWLIYQLLVRHFEDDPRVHIDVRAANEVHYKVFGQRYLAMHGDMLGVKGGDGIIGVIGPIMRGEVKTRGQATSIGHDYDMLLMGHWHQPLWLPRAIVANTLKGFDEYAKNALRASPSDPSQPLWFVHPSRGITSRWDVKVEQPQKSASPWVAWAGRGRMNIALDYDDTYNRAPAMWLAFARLAMKDGHDVRIVTARDENHDRTAPLIELEKHLPVIYTKGIAKRWFLSHFGDGFTADVWIDDKPESILGNTTSTPDDLAAWRRDRADGQHVEIAQC